MAQQPSRAVQDYLKTIHSLGGAEQLVSPMELAAKMEVRGASVTGMLKRLAEAGWIEYTPGRGAQLTELGTTEARRVIRRHRLMELFLTRVLGLDWSEVDAEAEALEHAISPRLEQAIADYLGEPVEDPHGHPIPTREGKLARRDLRPLHSFAAGQRVVIREVQDDHPERLRRWSDLGLKPGASVLLKRHHVLDGTFEVEVGGEVVTLAAEGLAGLLAEAPDAKKAKPSEDQDRSSPSKPVKKP
ncbi:MAG: metal-dependent transcriptional regulator [Gemmataceae bacterium]